MKKLYQVNGKKMNAVEYTIYSIESMIDGGKIHNFYCGGGLYDAVLEICKMEKLSKMQTKAVKKHFDIED